MTSEVWPGKPFPLGANDDGVGTNFSVFSEIAERIELEEARETVVVLHDVE